MRKLKTQGALLHFEPADDDPLAWLCLDIQLNILGVVKYSAQWKQWCFTSKEALFTGDHLAEIQGFLFDIALFNEG